MQNAGRGSRVCAVNLRFALSFSGARRGCRVPVEVLGYATRVNGIRSEFTRGFEIGVEL